MVMIASQSRWKNDGGNRERKNLNRFVLLPRVCFAGFRAATRALSLGQSREALQKSGPSAVRFVKSRESRRALCGDEATPSRPPSPHHPTTTISIVSYFLPTAQWQLCDKKVLYCNSVCGLLKHKITVYGGIKKHVCSWTTTPGARGEHTAS